VLQKTINVAHGSGRISTPQAPKMAGLVQLADDRVIRSQENFPVVLNDKRFSVKGSARIIARQIERFHVFSSLMFNNSNNFNVAAAHFLSGEKFTDFVQVHYNGELLAGSRVFPVYKPSFHVICLHFSFILVFFKAE
jgi:hypothetical protein